MGKDVQSQTAGMTGWVQVCSRQTSSCGQGKMRPVDHDDAQKSVHVYPQRIQRLHYTNSLNLLR